MPHDFSLSLMSRLISYISICPLLQNSSHLLTQQPSHFHLYFVGQFHTLKHKTPRSPPPPVPALVDCLTVSRVPAEFLRKLRLCGMLSGTVCLLHYSSLLVSSVSEKAPIAQLILRGWGNSQRNVLTRWTGTPVSHITSSHLQGMGRGRTNNNQTMNSSTSLLTGCRVLTSCHDCQY